MLGEKIGEATGKVTTQRVLPPGPEGAKTEVSFQTSGKILGVEISEIGTYCSVMRQGGALYGEGQGIFMTKDGDSGTWTGAGIGKPTGRGLGVSYRGCIYYQTSSSRLSRLNGTCGVFEYEVDENGNTHTQIWEWR